MWLTKFTVIFHLLAMIFLIHGVTSELNANGLTPSNDTQSYDDNSTEASTEFSNTFGATTPAISVLRHSKLLG